MSQETLKMLRLLIPGIIFCALVMLFYSTIKQITISKINLVEYSYILIPALAMGAVYNILHINRLVTNYSHKKIDLNIKNNIITLYPGHLTPAQIQTLREGDTIKNIFYKIVDNDPSLLRKANNVYFNGLLWTSTADAFIEGFFGSLFFFCSILIFPEVKSDLLFDALMLAVVGLISLLLHILTVFKHINLSNEQISFMETNCIKQVQKAIDDVLH